MPLWSDIERAIGEATGDRFRIEQRTAVGGGCINSAYVISGSSRRFFVKTNDAARASMFEAEAAGLAEIAATGTVRVPLPVGHGVNAVASWIVLEHIALASRSSASDAALGVKLAALHRCTSRRFDWQRDNTIGSTPQINTPADDWPTFWRERRLRFQLDLARKNGHTGKLQTRGEKLLDVVPRFFTDYAPAPSLLHGDLWSGNAAADDSGEPVIFDPAVYYGDREADLAMTELFGGYSAPFYAAYCEAWAPDAGYAVRKTLYNLYHVLNHLNLFGGSYLRQAEGMIDALLAEV